jgi:hypothetical protein
VREGDDDVGASATSAFAPAKPRPRLPPVTT